MTIRNGRHRSRSAEVTAVGVLLCVSLSACGFKSSTFELYPLQGVKPRGYPWRIAVVTTEEFTPYKMKFRYWSSTNFTWSLDGLPTAFAQALTPHFASVERLERDVSPSEARHDLIARMSVDNLHFDGANTTRSNDRVNLTMRFTIEQPNGANVFQAIVSASGSSRYRQPCEVCKPDPRTAFTRAFMAVFEQLSNRLNESDIRFER